MSELSEYVDDFVNSFMKEVHTAQPGEITKVVSTNPPIVNVQPGFMRLREGQSEAEKRPVIPNVPLVFPVFGDYGVSSSVSVGMPVLILAAERSIKPWMEQGQPVDPGVDRTFDLSDCIAIPGLPNKKTSWESPDDGIRVGKVDGSTYVEISGDKVSVTTPDITTEVSDIVKVADGSDFVALAKKVDDTFDAFLDAITNAIPVAQDGGAALQQSIIASLNISLPLIGSVASTKLKTD